MMYLQQSAHSIKGQPVAGGSYFIGHSSISSVFTKPALRCLLLQNMFYQYRGHRGRNKGLLGVGYFVLPNSDARSCTGADSVHLNLQLPPNKYPSMVGQNSRWPSCADHSFEAISRPNRSVRLLSPLHILAPIQRASPPWSFLHRAATG